MRAIYLRELKSYFYTPLGYIFLGVFLALASLIFSIGNIAARSSDMSGFFSMMSYVWMLLCPVLVMRLIAGERKQLTEQLLLSAPVSIGSIVAGKYLAACSVLLAGILLSLCYPLIIALQGRIYPMELLTAYLGFALQGCAFLAFDLMISSFSRNPTTASVLCFGANLMLWLSSLGAAGSAAVMKNILRFISPYERFTPFLSGQLSFANVVYFLVFSIVCVVACVQIVSARKWSGLA